MNNDNLVTKPDSVSSDRVPSDGPASLADWAEALAVLLARAQRATEAHDAEECRRVAEELAAFAANSRPASPEVAALDRVALDSARTLAHLARDQAAGRIGTRTGAWDTLAGQLARSRPGAGLPSARAAADLADQLAKIAEKTSEFASELDRTSISQTRAKLQELASMLGVLRVEFSGSGGTNPAGEEPPKSSAGKL